MAPALACGPPPALRCRGLWLSFKFADDRLEIARLAEIAVDRGEAHIGDVVEGLQPLHHQFADPLARDVALALALELAHDAVDHALDPLGLDRALAQGDLDRAHELVAVEGRAPAVLLDDREFAQLHALEGREAAAAIGADAAAADRRGSRRSAANPSPACRGCRNRGIASQAVPFNAARPQ